MYVGVGAARVRDLFAQARKHSPCIIFIDEIDAIGGKRGGGYGGGSDEYNQTLNQLLTEMDGFDSKSSTIIVLAATNRVDVLDKALLRPGRFDRRVDVPYPDLTSREQILKLHAANVKMSDSVDFSKVARGTPGSTPESRRADSHGSRCHPRGCGRDTQPRCLARSDGCLHAHRGGGHRASIECANPPGVEAGP